MSVKSHSETTVAAARAHLTDLGMVYLSESHMDNREYWGFAESAPRENVFLDHSATITQIGHQAFHVSDFS